MGHRGFSHIGLSTLDLDETRAFYQDVLGFQPVEADKILPGPHGPQRIGRKLHVLGRL